MSGFFLFGILYAEENNTQTIRLLLHLHTIAGFYKAHLLV